MGFTVLQSRRHSNLVWGNMLLTNIKNEPYKVKINSSAYRTHWLQDTYLKTIWKMLSVGVFRLLSCTRASQIGLDASFGTLLSDDKSPGLSFGFLHCSLNKTRKSLLSLVDRWKQVEIIWFNSKLHSSCFCWSQCRQSNIGQPSTLSSREWEPN